ncbi:MAG: hypothetical protein IJP17_07485 [Clostridia bacterium]|nr:hypothetical protein [Clostridia bacterium]
MNEKALIYVISFALMTVMLLFTTRWIMHLAYKSADTDISKVMEKRAELRGSGNPRGGLIRWLLEKSPDSPRTKRLLIMYALSFLPGVICIFAAGVGLFTHALDGFLDTASLAMIGYVMLTALAGTAARY